MRRTAAVLAALGAVSLLALPATAPAAAPTTTTTITMGGEQVTAALVADLTYFYRHAVRRPPGFALSGGGTSAGIADAVRGITDAAMVSRPLKPDDPHGLVLTPLAISGVCLVSNRANRVPAITHAQLQDLVAGRITTWGELPGSTRTDAIVPVALPSTMGAGRVFEDVFVDDDTVEAWQPVTVLTGAQERDYIGQTEAGFGYVDLALTATLHVIAYDGVPCTRATIRSGAYPARRPLGIVTRGRPTGALAGFLRWARTSATARRVIATRYIPA
jgi:phosphate transport system substrate-binding protein